MAILEKRILNNLRKMLTEAENKRNEVFLWDPIVQIGVACHLLGYDTGFMHTWRIREHIMIATEMLTGSRKTYGINLMIINLILC